jgi:hypothetical protein
MTGRTLLSLLSNPLLDKQHAVVKVDLDEEFTRLDHQVDQLSCKF